MGAKANTASSTAACHPETPHKKQGRLSSLLHGMRSSPKQDGHDDAARSDSRTSFESTDTVYALKHGQKSTVSTAAAGKPSSTSNGFERKMSKMLKPRLNARSQWRRRQDVPPPRAHDQHGKTRRRVRRLGPRADRRASSARRHQGQGCARGGPPESGFIDG